MADFRRLIPFIIQHEAGVVRREGESLEALFERARARGWADDPADLGGATQTGLTIGTYRQYRVSRGRKAPTKEDLHRVTYAEWETILRRLYWDRWKADEINSQQVANILVDWVWASGKYGITIPQKLLGVEADGIVGCKTIAAVNAHEPHALYERIYNSRVRYIDNICIQRPQNLRFKQGWLNRLAAIKNIK